MYCYVKLFTILVKNEYIINTIVYIVIIYPHNNHIIIYLSIQKW